MNTTESKSTIDVISKERIFSHSIDKVWQAITTEKEISTWFIPADFRAEVGYQYTFTAPAEQNCTQIKGVIKEASPYSLIYTWNVGGTDTITIVSWQLETVPEGTRLILEHSGISEYPGESAVKMFESFNGGWDNCVSGLEEYLNG